MPEQNSLKRKHARNGKVINYKYFIPYFVKQLVVNK